MTKEEPAPAPTGFTGYHPDHAQRIIDIVKTENPKLSDRNAQRFMDELMELMHEFIRHRDM